MTTITISKELTRKGDLALVPREEYEGFLKWQKAVRSFKVFRPTVADKRELARARAEYKKGNVMTLHELKRDLGITN